MIYGYARVSSADQNEARQIDALQKAGCETIYLDKQSGKDFERPEYQKMVKKLHDGDTLIVQSLDRFGRNYDLIKEQWEHITKTIKADIVVLDMPVLDTRQGLGLVGKLISDVVVQLLAFVSQTERENIRKRQAEGIRLAKERGVKFGREFKPLPEKFFDVLPLYQCGKISGRKAAEIAGMPTSTFFKKVQPFLQECAPICGGDNAPEVRQPKICVSQQEAPGTREPGARQRGPKKQNQYD